MSAKYIFQELALELKDRAARLKVLNRNFQKAANFNTADMPLVYKTNTALILASEVLKDLADEIVKVQSEKRVEVEILADDCITVNGWIVRKNMDGQWVRPSTHEFTPAEEKAFHEVLKEMEG